MDLELLNTAFFQGFLAVGASALIGYGLYYVIKSIEQLGG
jgi:hypothetical protein